MSNLDKKYEITQFFEYSGYDVEEPTENIFVIKGKPLNIFITIDEDFIISESILELRDSNIDNRLNGLNNLNKDSNICKYFIRNFSDDKKPTFVIEAVYIGFFDKKLFSKFMNNFYSDQKSGIEYILNFSKTNN